MEYNEYDFFDTIYCDEINSEFKFEFDRLYEIEFSVLIDENDNLVWPI